MSAAMSGMSRARWTPAPCMQRRSRYWAGTIYEDESNGFGDYVLSIDPLPAWLQ